MNMHYRLVLTALAIVILALALRLPGLGDFMTADEENWMLRSATFWHELVRNHNPGGTFLTTHPGALTMWLSGAGITLQEAQLGFDIDTSNTKYFRLAATLPIAIASSILIGVCSWLAMRLQGRGVGVLAGILLASEPYLVGMSQVVHLDMLLGLGMLGSVLALLLGVRTQQRSWLLLCGALAGMALANKLLPALWLGPSLVLAALLQSPGPLTARLWATAQRVGFSASIAALVFLLTWPAGWAKDDLSRSFATDFSQVVTVEHVALEASADPIAPASFYLRTLLGRTSPFVLITAMGSITMAILSLGRAPLRRHLVTLPRSNLRYTVLWVLYLVGFLVLITLVSKKGDRYALPALVILPLLASWTVVVSLRLLRERLPIASHRRLTATVAVVLLFIMIQPLLWSPYAIAYNNPLFDVRPLSQQGWGEGLDAAAAWLNQHPLAEEMIVASWYPGVLAPYFKGLTTSLSARDDNRVAFVVTYRNMGGRAQDTVASDVLDEFRASTPAHIVTIQGQPYAWIYNTIGLQYFPRHVGEITAEVEVGQTIPITQDTWSAIDIGMATFSSRPNTGTVVLSIRDSVAAAKDIRTVRVNATEIADSAWHRFTFDPIPDSAGQTYYVALSSPDSVPGNAVTAKFSEHDLAPGELFVRRQPLKNIQTQESFRRTGDMAYRVVANP